MGGAKGLPTDPETVRLAVRTEDHPMEYLEFSGEIPAGEYGGGQMTIWDTGTYRTEKWNPREVIVVDARRAGPGPLRVHPHRRARGGGGGKARTTGCCAAPTRRRTASRCRTTRCPPAPPPARSPAATAGGCRSGSAAAG